MAKTVRVGIIGTSPWTAMMFLPSFTSHDQAELQPSHLLTAALRTILSAAT